MRNGSPARRAGDNGTGRSPVGNSYLANVDAQTAAFLQNVAWETVQEYYGK